jgi:type IV pilus assembly protein PilY1
MAHKNPALKTNNHNNNKYKAIYKCVAILLLIPSVTNSQTTPSTTVVGDIPEVLFYDKPLYTFGGKTKSITMPISVEWPISSAAWQLPRNGSGHVEFAEKNKLNDRNLGYFNHRLCYKYTGNTSNINSDGYFYPTNLLSSTSTCGGGEFSGNFLNWATHTNLDMMRYALTGGSRYIDKPASGFSKKDGLTVLQRAKIQLNNYETNFAPRFNSATGVAPANHTYALNCKTSIIFGSNSYMHNSYAESCSVPNGIYYKARVQVCNELDASLRPDYCEQYPNKDYKPVGVLQKNSEDTRFAMLGYINYSSLTANSTKSNKLLNLMKAGGIKAKTKLEISGSSPDLESDMNNLTAGGVVRAQSRFIGKNKYDTSIDFDHNNNQAEWNKTTGVLIADANHQYDSNGILQVNKNNYKDVIVGNESTQNGTSVINYLNWFGFYDEYRGNDTFASLLGESLRYLANNDKNTSDLKLDRLDTSTPVNPYNQYTSRDPLYLHEQIKSMPNNKEALILNTDTFPFIKDWNWASKNIDDPVRSICEKDQVRLITDADINNWQSYLIKKNNKWVSNAFHEDAGDSFGDGATLESILRDDISTFMHIEGNGILGTSIFDDRGSMRKQNRYVVSALLAGANLHGITYKSGRNSPNALGLLNVKSTIIDQGEPSGHETGYDLTPRLISPQGLTAADCHLFAAGIYGYYSKEQIKNLINNGNGLTCRKWVSAKLSGDANRIDANLPQYGGYLFPSSPNKIIANIKKAFRIPSPISGNISSGVVRKHNNEVHLFKNDLITHKVEVGDIDSYDTSISTSFDKYKVTLDSGAIKYALDGSWQAELQRSLKSSGNRNIMLGGYFNSSKFRNNPITFKYADINNAAKPDADAINSLSIGLSQEQKNTFTNIDAMLKARIDYIRGDKTHESNIFRKRDSMLGSSANSIPVYQEKVPNMGVNNGKNMLYLGANDGMLHAINADTGTEEFSFIPRGALPKLYEHTDIGYIDKPLVESTPALNTIYVKSKNAAGQTISTPKVMLASGMGAGAKGMFAINVTKPQVNGTAISTTDIMFEFSDKDDEDMGHVIGQPEFVKIAGKDYIAVTSGYNNNSSSTGAQYLYLLDINKAYTAAWVKGINYYKYAIGDANNLTNNGLSAPASYQETYGTYETKYIYTGDLNGSLWKFDFSAKNINSPKVLKSFASSYKNPITTKPIIATSSKGINIVFGTGRYLGINDLGSKQKYQNYLINVQEYGADKTKTLADLNARHVVNGTIGNGASDTDSNSNGWYIVLPHSEGASSGGERIITRPQIVNGKVLFSTQMLGVFNKNECGQNQGSINNVSLNTGRNGNYESNPRFVGAIIVFPSMAFGSSNTTFGNVSTNKVSGAAVQQDIYYAANSASSGGTTNPITNGKTSGMVRSGPISWRELIDNAN